MSKKLLNEGLSPGCKGICILQAKQVTSQKRIRKMQMAYVVRIGDEFIKDALATAYHRPRFRENLC